MSQRLALIRSTPRQRSLLDRLTCASTLGQWRWSSVRRSDKSPATWSRDGLRCRTPAPPLSKLRPPIHHTSSRLHRGRL